MTTQVQRAANKRNSKKSTGPRSQSGKARSSANALRHGAYSDRHDPITTSILAEDPNEVSELIDDIIDELEPQTTLERVAAQTVAARVLNRLRVERLTAPLAAGCAPTVDDDSYVVGTPDNEVRFGRELLRALDTNEEGSDQPIDWGRLTFDLREHVQREQAWAPKRGWPAAEGPLPDDEFRARFDELIQQVFGSVDDARYFADALIQGNAESADIRQLSQRYMQAGRLLDHFERTTRLADHVDRGFDRALDSLDKLRSRTQPLDNEPNTRNEPNPNM